MDTKTFVLHARALLPKESTVFDRFGCQVESRIAQGRLVAPERSTQAPALFPYEGTYTIYEENVRDGNGAQTLTVVYHEPMRGEPVRGVIIQDERTVQQMRGFGKSNETQAFSELHEGLTRIQNVMTFRNGKERG